MFSCSASIAEARWELAGGLLGVGLRLGLGGVDPAARVALVGVGVGDDRRGLLLGLTDDPVGRLGGVALQVVGLLPGHRHRLGGFRRRLGPHLRGLVGGQLEHAGQTFAHTLRGGRGDRELVHLAAEILDLFARVLQVGGELAGVGGRGIAIGCENTHLGIDATQPVGDLFAVITAHHDRER
nr:hypothetical protein [Gordonia sp. NB41Y]